jgi:hypothetical protein
MASSIPPTRIKCGTFLRDVAEREFLLSDATKVGLCKFSEENTGFQRR